MGIKNIIKNQSFIKNSLLFLSVAFFIYLSSCADKNSFLKENRDSLFLKKQEVVFSATELFKPVPFISHADEKTPYLSMNINFSEVNNIRLQLENILKRKLITRGEAHVTLLTPLETTELKTAGLQPNMLEELSLLEKIQQTPLETLCIGEGSKGDLKTYYIVIKSEGLLTLRKKILSLAEKKLSTQSQKVNFFPMAYYPHITIGFTERDLHIQDGVVKDENSCLIKLRETSETK